MTSMFFCHAYKLKTHLKASVGNEGELKSLVGLLDPASENKMTNMSVFLCVYSPFNTFYEMS